MRITTVSKTIAQLEKGIEGITLVLLADDGTGNFVPVDTTVSDPEGNYLFDSLPRGNYIVQITNPTK